MARRMNSASVQSSDGLTRIRFSLAKTVRSIVLSARNLRRDLKPGTSTRCVKRTLATRSR